MGNHADRIPTREEHKRFIRRIWKVCLIGAVVIFLITGTITLSMFFFGYDPKTVLTTSTIIFQILVLSYGMGFFVPAFLTSLIKMGLGVEMSRQGLEIGKQTATILTDFKDEVKPIMGDIKKIVEDVRPVVHDAKGVFEEFKKQDLGKMRETLDRFQNELDGGGRFDRLINALERIAAKADAKADDAIGDILEEAWGEPPQEPVDAPEGT
jgi:hypothetical protein